MNLVAYDFPKDVLALWSSADTFKWIHSRDGVPADVYVAELLARDTENEGAVFDLLRHNHPMVLAYAAFVLLKMKSKLFVKLCEMHANDPRVIKVRIDGNVMSLSIGQLLNIMQRKFSVDIVKDFESSLADLLGQAKQSNKSKEDLISSIERLIEKDDFFVWNLISEEMRGGVKLIIEEFAQKAG